MLCSFIRHAEKFADNGGIVVVTLQSSGDSAVMGYWSHPAEEGS